VSWYQKGKTNLDFTEARDSEWQWHQLGYMQVCTSPQTDNHASTPPLCFLGLRTFPGQFPVLDDSRTRHFLPDLSHTPLVRESSFWKSAFIVMSANNILTCNSTLQVHSFLTVNLNTLSQVSAA